METFLGVTLVTIAGVGTGTIAWPMKIMRRLEFEHYWFVGMLAGLIIIPWSIVLVGCPNAFEILAMARPRPRGPISAGKPRARVSNSQGGLGICGFQGLTGAAFKESLRSVDASLQ